MNRENAIAVYAINLVMIIAGYALLAWVDWRIALGVFFINWGININISMSYRRK